MVVLGQETGGEGRGRGRGGEGEVRGGEGRGGEGVVQETNHVSNTSVQVYLVWKSYVCTYGGVQRMHCMWVMHAYACKCLCECAHMYSCFYT